MNKKLKGFLCRIFSEDEKIVTIGSILKYAILYIILAIIILGVLYSVYLSSRYMIFKNIEIPLSLTQGIFISTGLFVELCFLFYMICDIYNYLSKIEIMRCKKE